jgi:hypothetical protein
MQLAVSSDMLVEGRHFLSTVDPARLGHKALAVNLSDLAACGAKPLAFTLALALPGVDEPWLEGFSRGLFALADAHGCELVGGDTTRGPLNICITVFGEVPAGAALLRSGARAGDDIWVSGTLGDARLALEVFRGTVALSAEAFESTRMRMEQPTPRVALGQALRGIASSAVDVSDGLIGDLGHILGSSGVGATLDADATTALIAAEAHGLRTELLRTCAVCAAPRASRASVASRPMPACASLMQPARRCHSASARSTTSSELFLLRRSGQEPRTIACIFCCAALMAADWPLSCCSILPSSACTAGSVTVTEEPATWIFDLFFSMKSPMASALLNTVSSAGNTSLKVVAGAVTVLSKALS